MTEQQDKPLGCNHWPGQKRCDICGMGWRLKSEPTDQPEHLLDGDPLSVCATNALLARLATADAGWRAAIIAELGTRTGPGWEPYGGMCVP